MLPGLPVRPSARRGVVAAVLAASALVAGCSRSAQSHLDAGDKYAAEKKPAEALIEYRNAVQKEPMLVSARVKLADAQLSAGDLARALGEYVRAADLAPKDIDLQLKTANLLLRAGRYDDARGRADRVLALDPKRAEAHMLRANAMAGLSDFAGAVEQMQQALAIEGKAGYYANLGAIQLAQGQNPGAEQSFRKALELEPASIPVRLAWIQFLWGAGRRDEAEVVLKEAHRLAPTNETVNNALAAH
jgi:Flp pilus assembly protein TadD